MYKLKSVLAAVLCMSFTVVNAEDNQVENNSKVECTNTKSASQILSDQILEWRRSDFGKTLMERDANGQLVLLIGTPQLVSLGPNNAQFGKALESAFAKSFLENQAQFVKARSLTIETETTSEFFNAAPAESEFSLEDEEKGRFLRLGEKVFALTEAKLDSALRELGVSEDDIEKIEPSKKVTTFKDSLARTSTAKAFGAVAGVLPIHNFTATDCQNGASVAVISVFSDKNLEFAQDVKSGKPILAEPDRASGESLGAIVDEEIINNEIMDIYGLRKTYDQNGYPSLVSYGQWSFVNAGNSQRKREMNRLAALTQAESNAKAQIANYLAGSAESVTETMTNDIAEEFAEVTRDGRIDESATNIIEKQLNLMSSKAKVTLTGIRVLNTWEQEHPMANGVTMVGSVVAWSPQFADAINQATGSKRRQSANVPVEAEGTTGQATVRSSKAKNNAADF